MNRSFPSLRWVLPLLVVLPVGYRTAAWLFGSDPAFKFDDKMAEQGKDLFAHIWQPNDALSPSGDGLGPVFNAKSCVECHNQGGAGGGGPLKNNVTAFAVGPVKSKPNRPQLDAVASNFPAGETRAGVVHAFATTGEFRETLANISPLLPSRSNPPLKDILPRGQIGCLSAPSIGSAPGVDISQRNTPALFGANLIDAIPDRVIIANERAQRLKWGMTDPRTEAFPVGRALRLANGSIGKFGWKAQIGTLPDFVRAACANELGLGNPSQSQPASMAQPNYKAPGLDLSDEQCDQITAFVASLPRPVESGAETDVERKRVTSGHKTFGAIGCAECHTPDLGSIRGIYSDLLIHSMGVLLVGGGSYGEPPAELPEFPEGSGPLAGEWRTPPLRGVANSAPYLHDGRAETLNDAIRQHGGQADKTVNRYKVLPKDDQENLIAFLMTLRAPQVETVSPIEQLAAQDSKETDSPAEAH